MSICEAGLTANPFQLVLLFKQIVVDFQILALKIRLRLILRFVHSRILCQPEPSVYVEGLNGLEHGKINLRNKNKLLQYFV